MCVVAVEDELSASVAKRLLKLKNIELDITVLLKRGNGNLRKDIEKLCNAATNGCNIFLLTDLDSLPCAPALLANWFKDKVKPDRLLSRVAVKEVEAWLMADRTAFASFLGISPEKIDRDIEKIHDPKRYLLRLAERAKREVRRDLLPQRNAASIQGFGYNSRLTNFVREDWSPSRASENSPSLRRSLQSLESWITNSQATLNPHE